MATQNEMYQTVSEYCGKQECPKPSERKEGNCGIDGFCRGPIIVPNGFARFSKLPDILGMDLDVSYEILTGK